MFRWFAMMLLLTASVTLHAQDTDHDSLSDAAEQALLERFVPHFMVSRDDCGVRPASFEPDNAKPTITVHDGTIYGQAFVRQFSTSGGPAAIELHYYDLWSVDCGRMGHPLDAEHVSVLLTSDGLMMPAGEWTARYWYAAAHEDTVCDASTVVRAVAIDAEQSGATVWISAGKHAAYLDEQTCRWGCGGDRCQSMEPMQVARVVNLGERNAPMNGAVWVASANWPLEQKLSTDFSEEWMARLVARQPNKPMQMNTAFVGVKGGIYGANATVDGAGTGLTHTSSALALADDKTEGALGKSAKAVGKSLKTSKDAVGRFLGLKKR